MFLTRIGENSKLVVNGDPSQIDLINKSQSGLIKSKNLLKHIEEIKIIEFDPKWNDGEARQQIFEIFNILGNEDILVIEGRKKLSSMLFS